MLQQVDFLMDNQVCISSQDSILKKNVFKVRKTSV